MAPALLASALFSVVVVIPFLPIAKEQADLFLLEVTLAPSASGHAQIYFDLGSGWSEASSARVPLIKIDQLASYRFPLPIGSYRALRFDPLDTEGSISIQNVRIVSRDGRPIRQFELSEFKPTWQIASATEEHGRLEIITTAHASDPQLVATFDPPLDLKPDWPMRLAGVPLRSALVFFAMAAALLALDRISPLRRAVGRASRWTLAEPSRACAIVAGLAVLGSTYPIVFLGKSHVSPNVGTTLLYDRMPTLPGDHSTETSDVKGADIGAVMWWHLPLSILQHRALFHDHELPLWNRYNSGGTPLLGQGQSMFGDPIHLLVIAANGAAWAWDIKYIVAKWLFAFGLGLISLRVLPVSTASRESTPPTRIHLAAALIVTAAAPFVGFFVYRFNHPAFFSVCYAVWPLYCWLRVADAPRARATTVWAGGLIVANFALMNSGTAKEAYMLLLAMNVSGTCVLLATAAPWRLRFAKLGLLAWAGLLFALISAPFWATFMEALAKAHTAYNAPSAFQIQPSVILGAFDEIFYRSMMPNEMTFNPSANFVVLLGLLYFVATLRNHFSNRAALAIAASSLLPLSLAFGLIPPGWIVRVPFLGNVAHIDNTFSCALVILWSILAALGFAQAGRRLGTADGKGDVAAVALMLFAIVFAWTAFRQVVHRPIHGPTFTVNQVGHPLAVSPFVWSYLWSLLAACALGFAVARHALFCAKLTSASGILFAVCFLLLTWRHGLHASSVGFDDYTIQPTVRTDFHARSEAVELVRATQPDEPSRGYGLGYNFSPGWTGVYGIESIHGADPLVNPYFRELSGALPGVQRIWDWRLYTELPTAAIAQPYLDAFNVRYYLDSRDRRGLAGETLKLVKAADLDVYESPTVWPRAFFTDRIQLYDEVGDFIRLIGTGDGRPFAAVQRSDAISRGALVPLRSGAVGRTVQAATDYRLTENSTSFRIRAPAAGVVVLTEVFAPNDFKALINGRRAPVLRLNHAFKGLYLDAAGEYEISVEYRPQNFDRNLLLCGVGVLLLAASFVAALTLGRRDRSRGATLRGLGEPMATPIANP